MVSGEEEVAQVMEKLVGVVLLRSFGEVEGFKGWRDGGAPPWLLGVEREVGVNEGEREGRGALVGVGSSG